MKNNLLITLLFFAFVFSLLTCPALAGRTTLQDGDGVVIDSSNPLPIAITTSTATSTVKPAGVSSAMVSSDLTVSSTAGVLYGYNMFLQDASRGDGIIFYDGNPLNGTKIAECLRDSDGNETFLPSVGITYSTALFADVSTSGNLTATVVYE